MDPLSVTLAVITLTTAVKDLVELAQKTHESFSKVSNNFRNVQRVAEDIKEMVEEIRVFTETHKDSPDDMQEFCLAVHQLLSKFRSFETSILPLLPKTGGRTRDRFIDGWDAWRNNDKVEESILGLQSDIMKVIWRYIMKSTMRTEVKLEAVHQITRRGLADMHNDIFRSIGVLEDVRRDVSALRSLTVASGTTALGSYGSSRGKTDEFNRNVIMFAQSTPSTSVPMLRRPDVIMEEVATTEYIKFQINAMVMILEKMSKQNTSVPCSVSSSSNSVIRFSLEPSAEEWTMSITHLRRHVVRQIINMQDILDNQRIHDISINEGALALNQLSIGLSTLGMGHESLLVSTWAVTLARALVDGPGGGHPNLCAHLVFYLMNQSTLYQGIGDNIHSLKAIEEAYTRVQDLQNHDSEEAHFQVLYSGILLKYATLVDDLQQSVKMSTTAVHVLEDVLNVQTLRTRSSPSFLDHLFASAPTPPLMEYANALKTLGLYLLKSQANRQRGQDLLLLGVAVQRKLVSIGGSDRSDFATSLGQVLNRTTSYIPANERFTMANECIQIFQELMEQNPVFYAKWLVYMLVEKAEILAGMGQDSEAIATLEDASRIASQIAQDSKLCATTQASLAAHFRRVKRHSDAARTESQTINKYQEDIEPRALRYWQLSIDLQQLRRYKESIEAAQASVSLYQHLAMKNPKTWMGDVAEVLADLALSFMALGDYSETLVVWKESVSILDNFLDTYTDASSDTVDKCSTALNMYCKLSCMLKNREYSLQVVSTAVRHLRQLSESYPQTQDIIGALFWAEYFFVYNMFRFGTRNLQDAQEYLDNWHDPGAWNNKPEVSESDIAWRHATMINLKADVFDAQGHTKRALLTVQNARDVAKPFLNTCQPCFRKTVESMHHEARLRGSMGDTEEAVAIAEHALDLAQDSTLEPIVRGLVWSLHAVAFTAFLNGDYIRVVEAARGGCNIFNTPEGLEFEDNQFIAFLRPSLYALISSAEANLGNCSTAIEYAYRAVDASTEIGENKLHISSTTAEHSYMETQGNLAEILLTTGDFAQARQICEERKAYFSKRVEQRNGEYRDLAPILRMLGILCCSEGSHDEGEAAAQELSRIIKSLGSAFPSLQEEVKIRLRRQAQVPILMVLEEMRLKLDCNHHTEVALLLVI